MGEDIHRELEDLRRKETYLEVINSFATILFSAQTIDDIVWSVAKHAIAKLNYYDCVIYLFDEKSNKLIQSAAHGPKNPIKNKIKEPIKINPGQGIVGQVYATGIGEIVNDTSLDVRYLVDDERRYSEITIPIRSKGEVVGVIDSEHPEKNFFSDQDFKMLTTVAAMVSAKLEQAKANNELLAYQKNLEELVDEKTKKLEQTNLTLKKQNQEKEILIKEIHHRVKNNMQIMISLLNLQINTSGEDEETSYLRQFQTRIRSMSLIHERLYLENDFNLISIEQYLQELVDSLMASLHINDKIKILLKIEPLRIHLDTAIPLGLIVNEMFTNSIKHAFEDEGEITIKLGRQDDKIMFCYCDNGRGFSPEDLKESSFGTELIEILIEQLNGTLDLNLELGTSYHVEFPEPVRE